MVRWAGLLPPYCRLSHGAPLEHVEVDGSEELVLQELGDDPKGHLDAVPALQDGALEVEREVADDDQEGRAPSPTGSRSLWRGWGVEALWQTGSGFLGAWLAQ